MKAKESTKTSQRVLVSNSTSKLLDPDYVRERLEINESRDAFHVCVSIPGIKKEDIRIEAKGHIVKICLHSDMVSADPANLSQESDSYCISRRFSLPVHVDLAHVRVHYDRDVLNLTLPKLSGRNMPIDVS
ncbi:MAG: Hsp20/alpha crystallin family protein [Proteobacteria bacterium]|nr:Hsp20/alpha crystallin family protein [Pseudomonadota bacterium]MDE3208277.1 Hsp20/alpha crystallin family protein [Pseudomonadota bacterium]